jgi:hypothetical protein
MIKVSDGNPSFYHGNFSLPACCFSCLFDGFAVFQIPRLVGSHRRISAFANRRFVSVGFNFSSFFDKPVFGNGNRFFVARRNECGLSILLRPEVFAVLPEASRAKPRSASEKRYTAFYLQRFDYESRYEKTFAAGRKKQSRFGFAGGS